MTDTLVMMVALVAAGGWIIYQQLLVNKQAETLEEMDEHIEFLESVISDVARGDTDVWIEDGEVRAQKRATGKVPVY
jgi:hypothetical protein